MEVWYNFLTLVLFQSLTHQIENRTDGSSDFATTYQIFCRFFKDVPTLPTNWKHLLKDFSFQRAWNEFCLDSCKSIWWGDQRDKHFLKNNNSSVIRNSNLPSNFYVYLYEMLHITTNLFFWTVHTPIPISSSFSYFSSNGNYLSMKIHCCNWCRLIKLSKIITSSTWFAAYGEQSWKKPSFWQEKNFET